MSTIYLILACISLAIASVEAGPIIHLKRCLGFKQEVDVNSSHDFVRDGLYCVYCSAFWVGFFGAIFFWSPYHCVDFGAVVALLSHAVHKRLFA